MRQPGSRKRQADDVPVRIRGAFILGAPGTSIRHAQDYLVIGNQPGIVHYSVVAIFLPIGCGTLWLLWSFQPVVALAFFTLFGLVPCLILFNRQRFEVRPGHLAARGRALGIRIDRDWFLPPESAIRIGSYQGASGEPASWWTNYQAQVLTEEGWIGIAESAHREPVHAFSMTLAEAAKVPYVDAPQSDMRPSEVSIIASERPSAAESVPPTTPAVLTGSSIEVLSLDVFESSRDGSGAKSQSEPHA